MIGNKQNRIFYKEIIHGNVPPLPSVRGYN